MKILAYDGQGFWLCYKRLSKGRFRWWPKGGERSCRLKACDLQLLLWNGDPSSSRVAPAWRPLAGL